MESLIAAKSLPVGQSHIQAIQKKGDQLLEDAKSLICTPENLASVKSERARTQKEYDALEEWRKALKAWAMDEYKKFEDDYKVASKGYVDALSLYSKEIQETEASIKQDCEEDLQGYFAKLCAVHHLDWLTYEQAGIKVDMASAKAKTPKKLQEQLAAFVAGVAESVDRINTLEDAGEIMVEYQRTLDAADAICTVKERHQRVEEQKKFREARNAIRAQEAEMVRRVEALAPPVIVPPVEEKTIKVQLILYPTKSQFDGKIKPIMKQLKEICDMEGIQYE